MNTTKQINITYKVKFPKSGVPPAEYIEALRAHIATVQHELTSIELHERVHNTFMHSLFTDEDSTPDTAHSCTRGWDDFHEPPPDETWLRPPRPHCFGAHPAPGTRESRAAGCSTCHDNKACSAASTPTQPLT